MLLKNPQTINYPFNIVHRAQEIVECIGHLSRICPTWQLMLSPASSFSWAQLEEVQNSNKQQKVENVENIIIKMLFMFILLNIFKINVPKLDFSCPIYRCSCRTVNFILYLFLGSQPMVHRVYWVQGFKLGLAMFKANGLPIYYLSRPWKLTFWIYVFTSGYICKNM